MNASNKIPLESEPAQQRMTLDEAFQFAMQLHQANQLESAEKIYRQILTLLPEDADLLHFLGMLRHQLGFTEEGVELIKQSLALAPDYIDALNSLGNIYLQDGQVDLAETHFLRVIQLNPDLAAAYSNLGIALKNQGRAVEAESSLLKAIEIEPNTAHHYQNLANVYRVLKRYDDAVEMYRKAIDMQPADALAYQRLTRTFHMMGQPQGCIEVLKQWLAQDPDNPTALHLLAAYTQNNTPARASDDYVRDTFDRFAASFDYILKTLDYQAPTLVYQALHRLKNDNPGWEVLDAGCGTGLCGELIKPLTQRLVGVDLSAKMLTKAQARSVYDELHEAELTAFFAQSDAAFDVITCVDTFCYFGDLSAAMNASVSALRDSGWFIFTVEKLEEEQTANGFQLKQHGRYSHSEAYIRSSLEQAGYRVQNIDNAVLRNEFSEPVVGFVVTAQRVSN